jgi:hypothetical protein
MTDTKKLKEISQEIQIEIARLMHKYCLKENLNITETMEMHMNTCCLFTAANIIAVSNQNEANIDTVYLNFITYLRDAIKQKK